MTSATIDPALTPAEARVLGALVEKSLTTPDAYPLSLNALRSACNQTTNRDPVVTYDDTVVEAALASLRERGLARRLKNPGERVVKHRHVINEALSLDPAEVAVVCVLLLRAAQTPGELKQRTDRMHAFAALDSVETTLARLADRRLVDRLERRPGQKEARWRELLSTAGAGVDRDASTHAAGEVATRPRTTGPEPARRGESTQPEPVAEPADTEVARLDVVDASGTVIRSLATDTEHEVAAKVARARAAQRTWGALDHADRAGRLLEALERIDADRAELGALAARETGGDADAIARSLGAAADEALAAADGLRWDAPGVVAIITGATVPFASLLVTGARALVGGSSIVVKPSPRATLSALAIVERLHECGVPVDVSQCVIGGAAAGAAVVRAGIDRVCFAGEHDVGATIARLAGERSTPADLVLRSAAPSDWVDVVSAAAGGGRRQPSV